MQEEKMIQVRLVKIIKFRVGIHFLSEQRKNSLKKNNFAMNIIKCIKKWKIR